MSEPCQSVSFLSFSLSENAQTPTLICHSDCCFSLSTFVRTILIFYYEANACWIVVLDLFVLLLSYTILFCFDLASSSSSSSYFSFISLLYFATVFDLFFKILFHFESNTSIQYANTRGHITGTVPAANVNKNLKCIPTESESELDMAQFFAYVDCFQYANFFFNSARICRLE